MPQREQLVALVRAAVLSRALECGLSTRSVAELLVEVGDPRRFTEGGFARFNGTAPLAASTAEGPGEPVRHRYNPRRQPASERDPLPGWRSPSCAQSHAPSASTRPRAPTTTT